MEAWLSLTTVIADSIRRFTMLQQFGFSLNVLGGDCKELAADDRNGMKSEYLSFVYSSS